MTPLDYGHAPESSRVPPHQIVKGDPPMRTVEEYHEVMSRRMAAYDKLLAAQRAAKGGAK